MSHVLRTPGPREVPPPAASDMSPASEMSPQDCTVLSVSATTHPSRMENHRLMPRAHSVCGTHALPGAQPSSSA